MIQQARRTRLHVTINGKDVTGYIAPDLKEFSFKDEAKGKADEVQLTLVDKKKRWQNEWFIKKGSDITASLICLDWYGPGKDLSLPFGRFTVDEVELSGPPDLVKVKAVSAAKTTAMSEEKRTKGWETYSLQGIAGEIAGKHGYSLMYEAPDIKFGRVDQREESDLSFLNVLAKRYGVNLKVHDGRIILFGGREADAQKARLTIVKAGQSTSPESYSFKQSAQGTAKKAQVTYHDPAKRETVKEEVKPVGPPPSGQTLTLNQRAENSAQAIALGKGALRGANEKEVTASMEFMGFPALVAGITVECRGWGKYDGTYFVASVEHKVGQAYTTSAELRRTLAY